VNTLLPDLTLDGSLPIHARAEEIEELLRRHPVVILAGETGSGKSTQLPKLLLRAGFGKDKLIAITQPRRVAALTLARRVAEEMRTEGTAFVGHKVRFDNRTNRDTRVVFATDGTLLAELGADPLLRRYDAIVVDEAHERSLNVDFLIGVLRRIREKRPELRIVVASATIDTEAFAKAFCTPDGRPAPVVIVEGRTFPVDILYRDELVDEDDESLAERAASACREMMELSDGDLLCFLPGEKEIRETARELEKSPVRHTEIVPLFGRLSASDQDKVFHPGSKRRIILSTNVAETSVTVPRVKMVVDTGLARLSRYTPRTRTKRLQVEAISQASARQRAGRCGRIAPGICLRLYSREDFESREVQTQPEVQRADLSEVILRLLDVGLGTPENFPFLDPPDRRQLADGWQLLRELEAVDDEDRITDTGKRMARLPLDPRSARILLEAGRERCLREALILTAGLSIPDPRELPEGKEDQARAAQKPFQDRQSDFVGLLNLWEACEKALGEEASGNRLRKFCQKHFLSYMRMRDWSDAVRQISHLLESDPEMDPRRQKSTADYGQIHRALLAGFLSNICRLDEEAAARAKKGDPARKPMLPYRAPRGRMATPWPGSVLARAGSTWLVAAEIVETSRTWARTCAEVDPLWIEEIGAPLLKREYGPAHWDESAQQVACGMRVLLWGLPLAAGRRARAKDADPDAATECFCREALVDDRIQGRFPFLENNLSLRDRVLALEDRLRRRALHAGAEAEVAWYKARFPAGLSSASDLRGFLKDQGDSNLRMTESDLISDPSLLPREEEFPDRWKAGGLDLPLTYRFAPEDEDDGIRLTVPEDRLESVPDAAVEWLVPGRLPEKVDLLLRSLPRDDRQRLSPLSETARRFVRETALEAGRTGLREALSTWLRGRGVQTRPTAFAPEVDMDRHLRMLVAVVDSKGALVGADRNLPDLRDRLAERMLALRRKAAESATGGARRTGMRDWPTDLAISRTEEIRAGGMPVVLFPALSLHEQSVELRRFPSIAEANHSHREAVRALLEWNADGADHLLAWLPRDLQMPVDLALPLSAWTDARLFSQGLCESLRKWSLDAGRLQAPPRDRTAFLVCLEETRRRIREGRAQARDRIRALVAARRAFEETARATPTHRPDLVRFAELTRARLWPSGFPGALSWPVLERLPVWWETAARRLRSALDNPKRDQERAAELGPFVLALQKESAGVPLLWRKPGTLADADSFERLADLAYCLEEFRVQTWAQELGPAMPASHKRIRELFESHGVTVT
jgi:ATP-dependent helicase HrpA